MFFSLVVASHTSASPVSHRSRESFSFYAALQLGLVCGPCWWLLHVTTLEQIFASDAKSVRGQPRDRITTLESDHSRLGISVQNMVGSSRLLLLWGFRASQSYFSQGKARNRACGLTRSADLVVCSTRFSSRIVAGTMRPYRFWKMGIHMRYGLSPNRDSRWSFHGLLVHSFLVLVVGIPRTSA